MYIVFPKLKGDTPLKSYMKSVMENKKEFLDQLDYTKMSASTIKLIMPKFKIEALVQLQDVFKKMGINLAFKRGAEFPNLAKTDGIFISKILHKAFIEVNEEGSTAGAATSALASIFRSGGGSTLKILLNRPFMFFIKDEMTGVILFQGVVRNPK
ncbi:serpin B6 [Eurytemora carolleeae]|uniref:serpin B6 n=1 Tax=Eurytemora carolleeae TaxID=1294199 RepID=UPI000C7918EB|nr:serpin B6 [Eurytemora carolleeae]|eukprot:XP_023327450.1 serpin B6-like [Eurytemora affinis]